MDLTQISLVFGNWPFSPPSLQIFSDLLPIILVVEGSLRNGAERAKATALTLQLHFIARSESMCNHGSGSDKWRRIC
jgi:hypothetical protein